MNSVSSTVAGRLVSKHGRKVVIGGMFIAIFGLISSIILVWATTQWDISEWWLVLTLSFAGAGQGSVISPNQTLSLASVPQEYAGSSGAVLQTGQRIGTAIGLAVVTAAAFATLRGTSAAWPHAIMVGFAMITTVCVISLAFGFLDLRQSKTKATA